MSEIVYDRSSGLPLDASLGQWMTDPRLARALVRWTGGVEGQLVLEPGAGSGRIVDALLEAGARVVAVELDVRFARLLERRFAAPRVQVLHGDVRALCPNPDGPTVAVGNPPFEHDLEGEFLLHCSRLCGRASMIVRLHALASVSRTEQHWPWLRVRRLAMCVPRPPFHGSGVHEIAFVEVTPRRRRRRAQEQDRVALEWLRWAS